MKNKYLIILLLFTQVLTAQKEQMRPLAELINLEEPAWIDVENWIANASNKVEVLERDSMKADTALFNTQVTTRSPMGAIVYETGGILIDDGWVRILGSGSDKLKRSLPDWNKGKAFKEYGEAPSFLLIADDAVGGFFAINAGAFGQAVGAVYYLAPDRLEWECLDFGYTDFILWLLMGDLDAFYEGLRWNDWSQDLKEMNADQGMFFFPYLWSDYEDIEQLERAAVPLEEIWIKQNEFIKQFGNK